MRLAVEKLLLVLFYSMLWTNSVDDKLTLFSPENRI